MKIVLTKKEQRKEILTPLRKLINDNLIEKLYNCLQKHNIKDKELEKLVDEIDDRLFELTNKIDELEEKIENLEGGIEDE